MNPPPPPTATSRRAPPNDQASNHRWHRTQFASATKSAPTCPTPTESPSAETSSDQAELLGPTKTPTEHPQPAERAQARPGHSPSRAHLRPKQDAKTQNRSNRPSQHPFGSRVNRAAAHPAQQPTSRSRQTKFKSVPTSLPPDGAREAPDPTAHLPEPSNEVQKRANVSPPGRSARSVPPHGAVKRSSKACQRLSPRTERAKRPSSPPGRSARSALGARKAPLRDGVREAPPTRTERVRAARAN